jgi:hypothetical protein
MISHGVPPFADTARIRSSGALKATAVPSGDQVG